MISMFLISYVFYPQKWYKLKEQQEFELQIPPLTVNHSIGEFNN